MQVTINTENRNGRVRNFWNHIPFHPTDAGELQPYSPEVVIFADGVFIVHRRAGAVVASASPS